MWLQRPIGAPPNVPDDQTTECELNHTEKPCGSPGKLAIVVNFDKRTAVKFATKRPIRLSILTLSSQITRQSPTCRYAPALR